MNVKPRKTRKQPRPKLKSIDMELEECKRAFRKHRTMWAWCLHHDQLVESMIYLSPAYRLDTIIIDKPATQHAIRLRNFRPVKSVKSMKMNDWDYVKLQAQFDKEWPGNTWNGSSIF